MEDVRIWGMDYFTILGSVAGVLTTGAFLPQVIKTWQTKSAKDVSYGMLVIFCIGIVLWLIYGISLHAWPMIVANVLTLFFNLIIFGLKIKYE